MSIGFAIEGEDDSGGGRGNGQGPDDDGDGPTCGLSPELTQGLQEAFGEVREARGSARAGLASQARTRRNPEADWPRGSNVTLLAVLVEQRLNPDREWWRLASLLER
jgi:hypothetical protein